MDETPKTPSTDPAVFDPKRWVAAIVGGVVLGEALWALLQILVRDWATPALTNLMGQGPTQNQRAFELQPLFIAFVEACLAGILLVIILAATRSKTRVVRVRRAPAVPSQHREVVSTIPQRSIPQTVDPLPVERPVSSLPVNTAYPDYTAPISTYPPFEPTPAPEPMATSVFERPVPPAPLATETPKPTLTEPPKPQPKPQPKPESKPKKPKPVYYNIVGEPIESDEE
jgi:hypothetical protein